MDRRIPRPAEHRRVFDEAIRARAMTPKTDFSSYAPAASCSSDCGVGVGKVALASFLGGSALANKPHFPPRSRSRHLPLHGRRPQPARTVRLQAGACRSGTPSRRPIRCSRASASRSWIRSPRRRRSCSARAASSSSTARAASGCPNCSRISASVADDIAVSHGVSHGELQSRSGEVFHQHRLGAPRPSEHRLLGHLRHRQRIEGSAGLRGAAIRSARSSRRRGAMVQRLPAHVVSGRAVPLRRRSDPRPVEPAGRRRDRTAADARRHRAT